MNIKDRLRHLAPRALEDEAFTTDRICKIAQELHAVVVAGDPDQALYITRKYGIVSKSYDTNLEDIIGPFLFTPMALYKTMNNGANKIESLEADNVLLELKIKRLESL